MAKLSATTPACAVYLAARPAIVLAVTLGLFSSAQAQRLNRTPMPEWKSGEGSVQQYFANLKGYQQGDLISKGGVEATLAQLKKLGWNVSDRAAILKDTLDDGNVIVKQFQSQAGRKFMRKIKRHPLAFSQLDRVSRQYGGPALVRDIVRLPDGAKYASPSRARGVPNLLDLLPKRGGSRAQRIAGYGKPTGRIYTVASLLKRLQASYQMDSKKQGSI